MSTTASEPAETGSQIDVAPPEPAPEDGFPAGVSRTDAEKLDTRIRRMAADTKGKLDTLAALATKAKILRVHVALRYASWTAYLTDALSEPCSGAGIEVRRELVAYLYDAGMPQRAIAAAMGVNQSTVSRDLESAAQVMHDASPDSGHDGTADLDRALQPVHDVADAGESAAVTTDVDKTDEAKADNDAGGPEVNADVQTKAENTTGRDGKATDARPLPVSASRAPTRPIRRSRSAHPRRWRGSCTASPTRWKRRSCKRNTPGMPPSASR